MGGGGIPPRVKPSENTTLIIQHLTPSMRPDFHGPSEATLTFFHNILPHQFLFLFLFGFEFYFYSDSNFNKYQEPCPAPFVFMLRDAHCFQTSRSRAAHVAQHEDDWGRISQVAVWALNEHNRECENKITQILSKEFRANTSS